MKTDSRNSAKQLPTRTKNRDRKKFTILTKAIGFLMIIGELWKGIWEKLKRNLQHNKLSKKTLEQLAHMHQKCTPKTKGQQVL